MGIAKLMEVTQATITVHYCFKSCHGNLPLYSSRNVQQWRQEHSRRHIFSRMCVYRIVWRKESVARHKRWSTNYAKGVLVISFCTLNARNWSLGYSLSRHMWSMLSIGTVKTCYNTASSWTVRTLLIRLLALRGHHVTQMFIYWCGIVNSYILSSNIKIAVAASSNSSGKKDGACWENSK